jgi:hypothetical protein
MLNGGEGDGVWMTKREFAAARRITLGSADRMIRRHGWPRQRGNDGRARILVPDRWTVPADTALRADPADAPTGAPQGTELPGPSGSPAGSPAGSPTDRPAGAPTGDPAGDPMGALIAIAAALQGTLTEQTVRLADALAAQARAEAAMGALQERAVRAEEAAERLRAAEAAWWSRGRLARVLAAWRGT